MYEAYINIGSNLGDKLRNISAAIKLIQSRFSTEVRISDPISTQPWGYNSTNQYVNVGVAMFLSDQISPIELLDMLLDIEKTIDYTPHRNEDGSYRDRIIDIDLIALSDQKINTPSLIIPHPRMSLRDFVLIPMIQLMPQWTHPVSGFTPEEMLYNLQNKISDNSIDNQITPE